MKLSVGDFVEVVEPDIDGDVRLIGMRGVIVSHCSCIRQSLASIFFGGLCKVRIAAEDWCFFYWQLKKIGGESEDRKVVDWNDVPWQPAKEEVC